MKWFKHITTSWDDEKLSQFVDKAGLEGYGFWWRMLEIVASKVDENNSTLVNFSTKKWCSLLAVRPQKLRRLVRLCEELCMFTVVLDEDMLSINIPNILKYRDEWTKRKYRTKDKTPEQLQSKEEDIDTDIETESKNSSSFGNDGQLVSNLSTSEKKINAEKIKANKDREDEFDTFWELYPRKNGKVQAKRAFFNARRKVENTAIVQGLERVKSSGMWGDVKFIPHASTWLNGERWTDEVDTQSYSKLKQNPWKKSPSEVIAENSAISAQIMEEWQ